ncbi:branched-chain amino acid transport system substrate-binding protein [Bradyrhizobium elkanii]|uniref:ABC-type branched-subunit amino acid transport system substrate-binding protein n=2 Tax=Nitrobacteraceae TaxID=41294 RepID=A0A8I2C208_BRAEL|nr:ABC-type branched-subunit amino acid transport system substrate-binding protein [Bradyrhizobium elkanii]MCS4012212.1 ABC-type branched-subunit amino acid transport system substrate-binding protein [Bradyrhizobium elkanii USDA 61]MCP1933836.1 ABC-type branched-subunit amino acid transport system substrate-binding protein [Bradyrhizobium elkanii]MCP1967723.1 ABC-type branched-subunit amino acid transport system substrate-binding protein [Bradyrhizobium elkanii]MCS3478156.1 ABC-type branched-su
MHHQRLSYANCVKSAALAGLLTIAVASAANAQKKYDPGATDTDIKVGNIMPYSGPASAYATIGKTEAAYFNKLNSEGGINGRKVNFISYDDAYSPPKMVEQARKLVESDEVLLIFNPLGTPGNTAIQKYMNAKKVPQLFVSTGAAKWNDPKNFPWTMGWQPSYQVEARIYAKYILQNYPGKTIGVLYQNDDFGKDYLIGLHDGLGDQAKKLIVVESSYETSSPTVDSQIVQIKGANPDIFVNIATPKFAAQAIKKAAELDWHPVQFLTNVSGSIGGVMKPAGYEASQGVLSTAYLKDPKDTEWKNDPAMTEWRAFMTKWYPEGDLDDAATVFGYGVAKGLEQVLRQCGDNLTRENLMKQAASLNFEIGIYLPGTKIKTGPDDYAPIEQLQMMRFKGESWERFGPIMSGEKSS